jgi:hypothetical protein
MSHWVSRACGAVLAALFATGTGCLAAIDFKETCLTSSECAAGLFCNGGQCTDTCDPLESNCGAGKQCDSVTSKCVLIPSCTAANAASLCGKYACNTTTSRCYTDCQGPNYADAPLQCSGANICASGFTCRPACAATYAAVCAPFICDTIMGYCSNYCSVTADCASGYTCKDGECTL